jgi:hypothetical protein
MKSAIKTVIIATIFVISSFVVACKKDNSTKALIAGRWNLQHVDVGYYRNDTLGLTETLTTSASFINYVQFNNNGTFADGYINDVNVTLTDTTTGNYSLSGNTIKFSGAQSTVFGQVDVTPFPVFYLGAYVSTIADSAEVKQISSSNLVIQGQIIGPQYYNDGIFNVNKQVYTQYYSR